MTETYLDRIGGLIRDARKHRGLTQTQLADVLGTSQSAVHRIEAGNQNLSLEMVSRIAEALDSPLISVGGTGPQHLRVQGGANLNGTIEVRSSKNAAVALLCASLLNRGRTIIRGIAKIEEVNSENSNALMKGMANMDRHVKNIRENYGLPVIVALNRFGSDTEREFEMIKKHLGEQGVEAIVCEHFAKGSKGATELAKSMVKLIDTKPGNLTFVYDDADELWKKIGKVAKKVYHASEVVADTAVRKKIEKFQEDGFGNLPICIAKTQYSFSTDPQLRGAPEGHVFNVRDVYLNAGAGFMVVLSGEIMTMPGLPKVPASDNIDIDADGNIVGLA